MRTWKQGAVGRIELPGGAAVYVRCLRYPLAQFYRGCDLDSLEPEGWLCDLELEVASLKPIERLGLTKLGRAELEAERKSARDRPCGPEELVALLAKRVAREEA